MCKKMCNSIQCGIKHEVLVHTDVWSFLYVTTTLITPETFNKLVCILLTITVSFKETSPTVYTMGNEKMCQDGYQPFPSQKLHIPSPNMETLLRLRHNSPSMNT
jgi:hypothetical protein